jgi:hypothetical protein
MPFRDLTRPGVRRRRTCRGHDDVDSQSHCRRKRTIEYRLAACVSFPRQKPLVLWLTPTPGLEIITALPELFPCMPTGPGLKLQLGPERNDSIPPAMPCCAGARACLLIPCFRVQSSHSPVHSFRATLYGRIGGWVLGDYAAAQARIRWFAAHPWSRCNRTSPIQLRTRRASRASVASPSKSAPALRNRCGSTFSNAFTLTTA